MKFEEWIKYENSRQSQNNLTAWVCLESEGPYETQQIELPAIQDKSPVWTMIVQVFNTRRI